MQRLTGKKAVILVLSLIIIFFYGCSDVGYEEETILQEENTSNVVYQENINTVLENEEDIVSETQIVADYLEMNSEEFLSKYNKNQLYEKGFLYCGMESWKYQGTQLDAYQEDYYNVTDITAIRIRGKQESDDADIEKDLDTKLPGFVCIKYLGNYAISSYLQESMNSENNNDHALSLVEVSFIKVELEDGIPPEILYSYLENDYYQVREELQEALWTESPDGTKEAYISNGSLPSHPSQIFVRYKEEAPDSIFRREWQCEIVGWIDEEHLVCNEVDMGPILIHLENNQVEQIKKEDDDFDPYGAKYIIDGNYLICQVMDEEIYRWNIVSKEDEVLISAVGFEGNPYFSAKNHMYFKAQAEYDDTVHSKFAEEVVYAEMYLVKEYNQGSVYKFGVEPLGSLTDERLNTYFYVTNDKIYRLFSYVYQDNEMITFYDNDELLVEMLDTDEKLINNGQIVCQNEEVKSETKEGDIEFHFAISKVENQINYSSTTITPNGEIYYYESFVWEEGKGLIEFNSGYRAEREPLYLTEISEISEERYKKNRKADSTIQIFNDAEIQQCIWGEWRINEMYFGGVGWQECEDERKGVYMQFLPDEIVYDGQAAGVTTYHNNLLAIEDRNALFHEVKLKDLGFAGDYFLEFEASYTDIGQNVCPFSFFLLLNDTELIIPSGRVMYKAEKTGEIEEYKPLEASNSYSMCYGSWEVIGNVEKKEETKSEQHIEEEFMTSKELNSFVACRVFSVKNEKVYELVDLIDVDNNTYICCYEFSEDYYWDEMIMKDRMTAMLVKENKLYWAKRKSDSVENGVYHELF